MNEDQQFSTNTESQSDAYTNLFSFFYDHHDLILLKEELDDIIKAVDQFKKEYNA